MENGLRLWKVRRRKSQCTHTKTLRFYVRRRAKSSVGSCRIETKQQNKTTAQVCLRLTQKPRPYLCSRDVEQKSSCCHDTNHSFKQFSQKKIEKIAEYLG